MEALFGSDLKIGFTGVSDPSSGLQGSDLPFQCWVLAFFCTAALMRCYLNPIVKYLIALYKAIFEMETFEGGGSPIGPFWSQNETMALSLVGKRLRCLCVGEPDLLACQQLVNASYK